MEKGGVGNGEVSETVNHHAIAIFPVTKQINVINKTTKSRLDFVDLTNVGCGFVDDGADGGLSCSRHTPSGLA